ncbi:hypothetical protein CSQ85_11115 [Bifidobacterium rousetti]|uniref:DUF6429 family protein n=1 Tax=Bifidobacterium rousetti TaxID=2045439 RepID=UPI00123B8A47|nr:DUF6429 family protein [Bifidobacterium rousetti]KAA8816977.1 hypothetical protein CSQ85_11115 [Bifidobacterium rousetti]
MDNSSETSVESDAWRDGMIKDLTLMLLWLTSWDENSKTEGAKPLLRSWVSYSWGAVDALRDEQLVEGRKGNKSVYLTERGIDLAEALVDRYRNMTGGGAANGVGHGHHDMFAQMMEDVDTLTEQEAQMVVMSLMARAAGRPDLDPSDERNDLEHVFGPHGLVTLLEDDGDESHADHSGFDPFRGYASYGDSTPMDHIVEHIDTKYVGVDDPRSFLLRVTLRLHDATSPDGKPLVCWREIEMPAGSSFTDLHMAIQHAFDWKDYHLWNIQLNSRGVKYQLESSSNENSFDDYWSRRTPADADTVRLDEVFPRSRTALYTYDYGDNWEHEIKLVKTNTTSGIEHPTVCGSEGDAPPEDVGGPWGFAEFLKAYTDPNHPDHKFMVEWKKGIDSL